MVLSSSPRSSSLQFSRPANCILVCLDSGLPDQRRRRQRARKRRWASWSLDCIKILPVWHTHTHRHTRAQALLRESLRVTWDLGAAGSGPRIIICSPPSGGRGITWPPGASGGLRPEWVSIPGPFLSLCPWQRDGQPRSLNACRNSPLYFILGQPRGARWDGGWIPSGDQLSLVTPSSGPCLLWRETRFRGSAEEGAGFLSPTVGTSDRFHFFSVEMSLNEVLGSSLSLIRAGGGIKKDAKWFFLVLSQLTRLLGLNKLSSVYLGECELWLYGEKEVDCDMASCDWNSDSNPSPGRESWRSNIKLWNMVFWQITFIYSLNRVPGFSKSSF